MEDYAQEVIVVQSKNVCACTCMSHGYRLDSVCCVARIAIRVYAVVGWCDGVMVYGGSEGDGGGDGGEQA